MNSANPSPARMDFRDITPAFQPVVPVLTICVSVTVTPTGASQVARSMAVFPPSVTALRLDPLVNSDVSTASG